MSEHHSHTHDHSLKSSQDPPVVRKSSKSSRKVSTPKPPKVASGLGRLLQLQKLEQAAGLATPMESAVTPTLESESKTPRLEDFQDESMVITPIDGSPSHSPASLAPSKPSDMETSEAMDDNAFRIDSGIDVRTEGAINDLKQLSIKTADIGHLGLDRFEPRTRRYSISTERNRFQTDLSVIEFATDRVTNQPVILKTVHQREMAESEIEMLNLIAQHNIPHTARLLDAFVDTSDDDLPGSIPMQTPPPSLPSSIPNSYTPSIHRTLLQRTISEASGLAQSYGSPHNLHGVSPSSSHSDSMQDRRIQSDRCVLVFKQLVKPELKHLDLIEVARLFRQLCEALSALGNIKPSPIAHLDVCTNNIMMDMETKDLVLIDFGLARLCQRNSKHPEGRGTAGYVAPEMYVGRGQGTIVDAYSAGVVFGCLLEPYVPACDLNYLGSRLVRHPTTTFIQTKLHEFVNNREHAIPDIVYRAADLLAKLLEYDPAERLSCEKALEHPFLRAKPAEFGGTTWREWQQRQGDLKRSASARRLAVRVSYRG